MKLQYWPLVSALVAQQLLQWTKDIIDPRHWRGADHGIRDRDVEGRSRIGAAGVARGCAAAASKELTLRLSGAGGSIDEPGQPP